MPETISAAKAVKQSYQPTPELLQMMEIFRRMANDCLRVGLANNISTMKRLSKLCYAALDEYDIVSYYKLHAISKTADILSNRKQSIKRGYPTKNPYMKRTSLISSYDFGIQNGVLKVPLDSRRYSDLPLNAYVRDILPDPVVTIRSFTLTAGNKVRICYSKQVAEIECATTAGVDRNLANVTYGNQESYHF